MVVLNRIYTRSGDDGTTALGTGERRKKYDLRIAAYGTLDEVNAVIVGREFAQQMLSAYAKDIAASNGKVHDQLLECIRV